MTETFQGYDEPSDFPFADRLPPLGLRHHYGELLRRWLRDSEGRAAWDHWIGEVEKDIDLSAWAAQRDGLSFAFPRVVHLRWDKALSELEQAASRTSATEAFFAGHMGRIKLEAEFTRASDRPIGAWPLLLALGEFVDACQIAENEVSAAAGAADLAKVFVRNAARVDGQHVILRREAEERDLPSIAAIADRCYASYTNALNDRFFKEYAPQGSADLPGIPLVTSKLERDLWESAGHRAVIIVDALRFDCALAIRDKLRGQEVEVEPMRAELPTITRSA